MATISKMIGTGSSWSSLYANKSNQTAAQKNISSLWSSYNSFSSNANNSLAGLSEIKSGVSSLMASYNSSKDTFYSEFDGAMEDLSSSAKNLKNYDFTDEKKDFSVETKTTTDKDGNKVETKTYSKDLQAAVDTVKNLVNDYNVARKFLSDNSSISGRISSLAKNFSDTTYRASSYQSIGISVGSNGGLSIDEDKLVSALTKNPSSVQNVLGKDGLAGKAEQHINFANSQRSELFPSANKMLGDQLKASELYTGGTYAKISALNSVGNFFNLMT